MDFVNLFLLNKEQTIVGRYINLDHIKPLLLTGMRAARTSIIGYSVLKKPIYKYVFGTGKTKILMWSQMHGNESTTTKSVFDLLNFLDSNDKFAMKISEKFTLTIVPILNPDGAEMYTRENANGIDLNRDAMDLSQPESLILRNLFDEIAPNFCYNLHDQRTIYGVGKTNMPATVSFLAPAYEEAKQYNDSRNSAIAIICKMNRELQKHIPNQVGRFDDSYNPNCVGDTFQTCGVPTILFEAGHYKDDYDREETRKYVFIAILTSLQAIYQNTESVNCLEEYLKIPLNNTRFLDIIYKNVTINYENSTIITNFAAQFIEECIDNKILFSAIIEKIGNLDNFIGHCEYDFKGNVYSDNLGNCPQIGQNADFYLDNGMKIVNGMQIK